jgi:uncharacterized protein
MAASLTRRKFIKLGLTATLVYSAAGCSPFFAWEEEYEDFPPLDNTLLLEEGKEGTGQQDVTTAPSRSEDPAILKRPLGKTGFQVSVFGLGGSFAIARDQKLAEKILNRALDLGVNYIDTAPTYGGSEVNIGRALEGRRSEYFLASKTLDRTYDGTLRLFEQSLKRLRTDRLDLLQLHGVHTETDLKKVFSPKGALRALEELKSSGLISYIGITGHRDPKILLNAIEEHDYDCLLLPLNAADRHFRPFQDELLQAAQKRDIGIIAMKVASYGRIFKKGGITSMEQALGYVLSFPVSTAIIGVSSMEELEENVCIASGFKPLSRERQSYLEQLVKSYYKEANFFKTSW